MAFIAPRSPCSRMVVVAASRYIWGPAIWTPRLVACTSRGLVPMVSSAVIISMTIRVARRNIPGSSVKRR